MHVAVLLLFLLLALFHLCLASPLTPRLRLLDLLLSEVRPRRSIARAVVESMHCEHVDLVDCSSFATDDMQCMVTATGMTCCVCTGKKLQDKPWTLFRLRR